MTVDSHLAVDSSNYSIISEIVAELDCRQCAGTEKSITISDGCECFISSKSICHSHALSIWCNSLAKPPCLIKSCIEVHHWLVSDSALKNRNYLRVCSNNIGYNHCLITLKVGESNNSIISIKRSNIKTRISLKQHQRNIVVSIIAHKGNLLCFLYDTTSTVDVDWENINTVSWLEDNFSRFNNVIIHLESNDITSKVDISISGRSAINSGHLLTCQITTATLIRRSSRHKVNFHFLSGFQCRKNELHILTAKTETSIPVRKAHYRSKCFSLNTNSEVRVTTNTARGKLQTGKLFNFNAICNKWNCFSNFVGVSPWPRSSVGFRISFSGILPIGIGFKIGSGLSAKSLGEIPRLAILCGSSKSNTETQHC